MIELTYVVALRCTNCAGIGATIFSMKRGPRQIHPGETMRKQAVAVDEMTLRKLRVLGKGNISAGVREAARVAFDRYQGQKEGPGEGA